MLYSLLKDKTKLWNVIFVEAIIQMAIAHTKVSQMKKSCNTWVIKEDKATNYQSITAQGWRQNPNQGFRWK